MNPIRNWNLAGVVQLPGNADYAVHYMNPIRNWNCTCDTLGSCAIRPVKNYMNPIRNWNVKFLLYFSTPFYNFDNYMNPIRNWNVLVSSTLLGDLYLRYYMNPIRNWNKSLNVRFARTIRLHEPYKELKLVLLGVLIARIPIITWTL